MCSRKPKCTSRYLIYTKIKVEWRSFTVYTEVMDALDLPIFSIYINRFLIKPKLLKF